jgi:serine/threonine-protein kinase
MGAGGALPVIGANGTQPPARTAIMPTIDAAPAPLNLRSAARAKEEQKRKNRQRAIIIAIIAAILCVAGIGAAVYFITSSGTDKVEVPNIVGATEQEATDALKSVGLKPGTVKLEAHATVEAGRVISTNPSAKTMVDSGSSVNLVISSGPEPPKEVTVPDLTNKTAAEAKTELEALKLKYERGDDRNDAAVDSGKICGQEPAANATAKEGDTVTIHVSLGKEMAGVPSVIDMSEDVATLTIQEAGFKVGYSDAEYSDKAANTVIRQNPTSGITAERGSTITITLSRGPQEIPVPNLIGLTYQEAVDKIQNVGLKIRSENQVTDQVSELDKVITQDPPADSTLPPGGTVTVYIGTRPATPTP